MTDAERPAPTVLVIDDSELVLEMLTVILEDEGWVVHTRTTPFLEAREIAELAPRVVLLDIGIPGVTDADLPFVVSTLRAHGAGRVLFHSGRHADELEAIASVSGADGFVCKAGDDALIEALAPYRG